MSRSTAVLLALLVGALPACGDETPPTPDASAPAAAANAPTPAANEPTIDRAAFEQARDRALALHRSGQDPEELRDTLLAAHALDPDAYGVNTLLGQVLGQLGHNDEALRHFSLALDQRPEDQQTRAAMVRMAVPLGRHDLAQQLLPALEDDPRFRAEALYLHALVLDREGRRDAALALLEQARELPPQQACAALSLLGRWRLADGRLDDAHALLSDAIAACPDDTATLKGLADTCWRMLREDEARHWSEVLELMLGLSDNVFLQSEGRNRKKALAESDYLRELIEGQRRALERLVVIHATWAAGFEQLAELQLADGDGPAACATIERLLEHHGPSLGDAEAQRLHARFCGAASR